MQSPSASAGVKAGRWWEGGCVYQPYLRSWQDTDGDGYGDLPGVVHRLDHLTWLGVDALWLTPTMPSPDRDWGYDITDYYGVHPELGTAHDLAAVLSEAEKRGVKVLLDLVPNHTSDAHPWFVESRSGKGAPRRDWYVWADPGPGGAPPNNWVDATGGPAWTLDEGSGQYYLHNFLPGQPDLNWWTPGVRQEFEAVLRFWFDRGVAGVRIDVAHGLFHDLQLRNNPPAPDGPETLFGQARVYNMNRPEVHDVYRSWRRLACGYHPARLALAVLCTLPGTVTLYAGDELGLTDMYVAPEEQRDPITWQADDGRFNRDRCRTPMPWDEGPNSGFCPAGVDPWLPVGDRSGMSVASQIADSGSTLWLTRSLLQLRSESVTAGDYEQMPSGPDQWIYRGGGLVVAANFSDIPAQVELPVGSAILSSRSGTAARRREGSADGGPTVLEPWEAVVVQTSLRTGDPPPSPPPSAGTPGRSSG